MSDSKNTPHDSVDDPLETAAEFRRQMGGITQMTVWRWQRRYPELKPIKIAGRNYYRRSQREAFIKAREREAVA